MTKDNVIDLKKPEPFIKDQGRDYKNEYTDVRCLENIGLIGRAKKLFQL